MGRHHAGWGRHVAELARPRSPSPENCHDPGRSAMTDLDISGAWLVDPAAGREGPGDVVVRDGVLESVIWLDGADADGIDDRGVVVAPGFIDLHAHFREPGNEEAETIASGSAAAAHGGFTTVC